MVQIGIDFGGTKIEAAALSSDGAFLSRIRRPNPGDYDAALQTVRDLVEQTEREIGAGATVGIGTPGSRNPRTGLMRGSNSTYLNGRPFLHDLARVLGRELRMANDANCMALSEATDGAAAGASVAFGVIIGTGVGGGLVVNGRIVEGASGIAGEWGHLSLPWMQADEFPGPTCWCGQHGCIETWVSGTGLQQDHQRRTGEALTGPEIVAAADKGDADAVASLSAYVDRLGRALAGVVNLFDPDVIVLAGGMSNVQRLYADLPHVIRRHAFCDEWLGRVVQARWGDSSGVRGAARLWA